MSDLFFLLHSSVYIKADNIRLDLEINSTLYTTDAIVITYTPIQC
jgi:hypothetical protein